MIKKVKAAIIGFVLLQFSMFASAGDFFSDPTYGGKFHWTTAYGLQHGAIQLLVQEGAEAVSRLGGPEWLPKATRTLGCVGWVLAENDPVKNLDSVLDWVTPCLVGALYPAGWWYSYDNEKGFILLPENGGVSVNWVENF